MAVSIGHSKTSAIPDGADTSLIRPSDWNAGHIIAGLGGAAELNVGTGSGDVAAGDHLHTGVYAGYDDARFEPTQYVQVAKNAPTIVGSWYSSIKSACDWVATQSPATAKRFVIFVHPGEYTESPFTIPTFTYVTGSEEWGGANIITNDNNAHFISCAASSGVMRFRVTGPTGVGFYAVGVSLTGASSVTAKAYWINLAAGYYGFYTNATSTGTARMHCVGCVSEGTTTTNTLFRAEGKSNIMMMESGPMTGSGMTYGAYANGASASLTVDLCQFRSAAATSIYVDNGAVCKGISATFAGGTTALHQGPNGGTITVHGSNIKTGGYTTDLNIAGSSGSITFSGALTKSKVVKTGSTVPILVFADPTAATPGQYIYGELLVGDTDAQTPLTSWIDARRETGVMSGGAVTRNTGLSLDVASGTGFFSTVAGQVVVSWGAGGVSLPADTDEVWITVSNTGVIDYAIVYPDETQFIILAVAATNSTDVMFLVSQSTALPFFYHEVNDWIGEAAGPVNVSGSVVTKNGTNGLQLDVTDGVYFLRASEKGPVGGTAVTFTYWYQNGVGGWSQALAQTAIDATNYDDGSGTLAAMAAGKFRRDLMYVTQNDSGTEYHVVYGQTQIAAVADGRNPAVLPDILQEHSCRIAAIIVQKSATDVDTIVDQRPRLGQLAAENVEERYNIIAAGGVTAGSTGVVNFSNSNGVSFGMSTNTAGNTMTAQVAVQSQTYTLSGNSNGNSTVGGNGIVFEGGNNITLSGTGQTIIVSAGNAAGGQFSAGVSTAGNTAGATGVTGTQIVYVGGANITLSQTTGANGATITIVGGAGAAGNTGYIQAGTTSQSLGTMSFADSNGISFGLNAGTLTASYTVPTQSVQPAINGIAAGTRTATTGSVLFGNANNVTFGLDAASTAMTASIPAGATATGNMGALGASTQTATSGTVIFGAANNVSFGMNNQTMTASIPAGATATGNIGSIVGSNATYTSGAVTFTGSGAVTVRSTTGQQIVIDAPVQTAFVFSNSNNVSFGTNGSTVTATATFAQSADTNKAGTGFTSAGNNIGISGTLGTNGLSLSASVATTYRASNDAVGLNTALTAGPLAWTVGSAGISLNAGSAAGTTSGFAGNSIGGSMTFNTAGLNLSLSHPAWITTAAQSNHSHGNPTLALTGINGTTASASNGLTLSLSVPQQSIVLSGSNGSISASAFTFGNLNGLSFYTSNGSIVGSYTDAGAGAGISAVRISAGTTNSDVSNFSFANGSGVSWGINGSTITASVNAGGGATLSQRFQYPPGVLSAVAALGNGSFSLHRMDLAQNLSATRLEVPFLVSIASGANPNTWGLQATVFAAIYTKNGSTLSSLSSGSTAWSLSLASNSAGSTQVIPHAVRPMTVPFNINMTPGEYYIGFGVSTNNSSVGTATTALGNTWSIMGAPIYSSAVPWVEAFSATTNTSTGLFGGHGVYSAAISTVPPTVSLSAINQTGSYYARANMGLVFRNI